MSVTASRRAHQEAYNKEHGIVPKTVVRPISNPLDALLGKVPESTGAKLKEDVSDITLNRLPALIDGLRKKMKKASAALEFEEAAALRDRIKTLEEWALDLS